MKIFLSSELAYGLVCGAAVATAVFIIMARLIKKSEYARGFTEGARSTLNDFQIQYQKFENINEKMFSSDVETGYFMQLTYRGLPIGDVTKRIIHSSKKIDKKKVGDIMNKPVMALLTALLMLLMCLTAAHAQYAPQALDSYDPFADSSTFVAQLNNDTAGDSATTSGSSSIDISWHKVFGWGTLISAAATVSAIGLGYDDAHCGLAYFSTAMAVTTCATGYYSYSDVLGSDTRYTLHAALGALATAGFGITLALADDEPHVAAGAVSGAVFIITVGTVYF